MPDPFRGRFSDWQLVHRSRRVDLAHDSCNFTQTKTGD
jgi:hypothetical protein